MKQTFKNIFKLIDIIRDMDRQILILMILRSIFTSLIPFGTIIISANIIDKIIAKDSINDICAFALIGCAVVFVMYVVQNILHKFCEQKKNLCVRKYDTYLAKHSLKIKYEYLESEKLQSIRSRMQEDKNWGYGIYSILTLFEDFSKRLVAIIVAFASILPLFLNSLWFGIACLIYFAVLILMIVAFLKFKKRAYNKQQQSMVEVEKTNRLLNYFVFDIDYKSGKDIRIYKTQDLINEKGASRYFILKKEMSKRIGNILGVSDGFFGLIVGFSEGMAYMLVVAQAIANVISIGEVISYSGFINQFSNALSYFTMNINDIIIHVNRFINTFDYMDIPEEKNEGTDFSEKLDTIEFRNVSFSYPNSNTPVLKNINLKLKANENIAIVGRNGSGKSTFIKLLCRFYKPTSGQILFNGIDISKINMSDYMNMLSAVFQDYTLFSIPIEDNICVGAQPQSEQLSNALKQAGIGEKISSLPKAEKTPVFRELYDDGVDFSGGEAQKLAIARAIYKETPILILDEPTASLDPFAEAEIYSNLGKITNAKTSFFISHRLASCKFCDNILVFNDGEIAEQGSHEVLLDKGGLYNEMWSSQANNYIA